MKLTKRILTAFTLVGLLVALVACGSSDKKSEGKDDSEKKTLLVGASPTPHAEILDHVKEAMKKEGYDLEVKVFDDYVLPNKALEDGSIDANYYQHIPYLNLQIKENGYKFENAGAVHLEPIGLYSKKIKDIKDLKDGATLITSNSPSDWGRIISILSDAGLVKVKEGVNLVDATFDDIVENPKHLKFKNDINPEVLTTVYNNDEAELVAINANFALNADLNPSKDAVLLESDNSPYVNVVAVREGEANDPRIKALIKVLHEKETQDWILQKWGGSVKPVAADAK
jgi:D-methionine transport system substrate-binding protein